MRQAPGLVGLFDLVTAPGSPFADRRGYAVAQALIAEGILEKSLKKPPETKADMQDYLERLMWWIEQPMREREERKRRKRRRRPPS